MTGYPCTTPGLAQLGWRALAPTTTLVRVRGFGACFDTVHTDIVKRKVGTLFALLHRTPFPLL